MTNKTKGIIVSVSIAALGAAYVLYVHSKKYYAKSIVKAGKAMSETTLMTFDKAFLQAWYKSTGTTFSYNGKTYNSKGGRATVPQP